MKLVELQRPIAKLIASPSFRLSPTIFFSLLLFFCYYCQLCVQGTFIQTAMLWTPYKVMLQIVFQRSPGPGSIGIWPLVVERLQCPEVHLRTFIVHGTFNLAMGEMVDVRCLGVFKCVCVCVSRDAHKIATIRSYIHIHLCIIRFVDTLICVNPGD